MIERGGGKILNIASLLSFQGGITVPAYAASKGGVAQLTKALANEWAAKKINVNAIRSGLHAHGQHESFARGRDAQSPDTRTHSRGTLGRSHPTWAARQCFYVRQPATM